MNYRLYQVNNKVHITDDLQLWLKVNLILSIDDNHAKDGHTDDAKFDEAGKKSNISMIECTFVPGTEDQVHIHKWEDEAKEDQTTENVLFLLKLQIAGLEFDVRTFCQWFAIS